MKAVSRRYEMNSMNWLPVKLSAVIAFVLLGLANAGADAATDPSLAPGWNLKTADGALVSFPADAQGRPTVLLFWPSWCPFSRALQPYVQDIWADYRSAGVNVWTLNIRERGDPVQAMKERGLSFPLLLAADGLIGPYGINRTPWLVVVDGNNRIVYTRPPDPPTPIDVAKAVRVTLNGLLGEKAVPLPKSYPPPYDLHLKKQEDLVDRRAPTPIAEGEWEPWVEQYLAGMAPDERVADLAPRGPLAGGKDALALAREVWTERYGEERVRAQAPYRAFRRNDRWIVMGQGLSRKLGEGLVLVVRASDGQVLRVTGGETAASSNF